MKTLAFSSPSCVRSEPVGIREFSPLADILADSGGGHTIHHGLGCDRWGGERGPRRANRSTHVARCQIWPELGLTVIRPRPVVIAEERIGSVHDRIVFRRSIQPSAIRKTER